MRTVDRHTKLAQVKSPARGWSKINLPKPPKEKSVARTWGTWSWPGNASWDGILGWVQTYSAHGGLGEGQDLVLPQFGRWGAQMPILGT